MTRISLACLLAGAALVLAHAPAQQTPPAPASAPGANVHDADALPAGAVARLGSSRFRFGDHVTALRFTDGGKGLLAANLQSGRGGSFCLFDAASGREVR